MVKTPTKSWITEGVFLALLPIFGYLLGLVYELGYADYFEIPSEIIEVSISKILFASLSLAFFLFLGVALMYALGNLSKKKHPILRLIGRSMTPGLPALVLNVPTAYFTGRYIFLLLYLGICIFIFATGLIVPALIKSKEEPYWDSVRIHALGDDKESESDKGDWTLEERWDKYKKLTFGNIVAFVGVFSILIVTSYGYGRYIAQNQNSFWTIEQKSNLILLRKYGDNLIGKSFDPETKLLNRGVLIFSLKGGDEITIVSTTIEGLKKK